MVEIIKRGTKQTRTCKNCGCIFSYDEEDVERDKQTHESGTPFGVTRIAEYGLFIKCPQCGEKIVLKQLKGYV
jgi:DNA-directed RNA polymerase subunit RPC12/RpoP